MSSSLTSSFSNDGPDSKSSAGGVAKIVEQEKTLATAATIKVGCLNMSKLLLLVSNPTDNTYYIMPHIPEER